MHSCSTRAPRQDDVYKSQLNHQQNLQACKEKRCIQIEALLTKFSSPFAFGEIDDYGKYIHRRYQYVNHVQVKNAVSR